MCCLQIHFCGLFHHDDGNHHLEDDHAYLQPSVGVGDASYSEIGARKSATSPTTQYLTGTQIQYWVKSIASEIRHWILDVGYRTSAIGYRILAYPMSNV